MRISDESARHIGFGVIVLLAVVAVADTVRAVAEGSASVAATNIALSAAFCSVLFVCVRAQPRNPAVWVLLAAMSFGLIADVSGNVGESLSDITYEELESGDTAASPSSIDPLAALSFALSLTLWVPGSFLLAIHLLVLFPNGTGVSRRWRRTLWATAILMTASIVAGVALLGPWSDRPYDDGLATGLAFGPTPLLMLVAVAAVVNLVARYRASSGEERQQYRWITWALSLFVVNIFLFTVSPDWLLTITSGAALINIAVAFGIAITKYRLYDIDVVINRSLRFGALAVFIGGVYVGIVVGIGELLGGESGFGLSIVASVLVAMAFQPMRRRVERWANRVIYGERATPYEVLVRFSRRSAELSDEELIERIPQMIADGTGATSATLWNHSDDGFHIGSTWPAGTRDRRIDGGEAFDDCEADYSVPVFHDGELLGGLSLVKAAGETVTPSEEELLADLASGLGLALRNARLTHELRRQIAELEASRERVLAASDEARRALENDLDSGPQQQLVALKVKLGPTRKLAERAGAEKTAKLLEQLEADAGAAIQAVRDFAGGIYPPLLEAEGLVVAINQQTRSAAIPIDITGEGIGRYGRDVEAAVYFAVLEALQNTAKYAEARSVSVLLRDEAGSLHFEVHDDGRGFDAATVTRGAGLTGMADRLDTVGGSVTLASTPGEGTVVSGAVPIRELIDA